MNLVKKLTKTSLDSIKNYKDNKDKIDADEKWVTLFRERNQNCIYKWIDVKAAGNLYEIYDTEGKKGVVQFASENIAPLLYNDGVRPESIQYSDLLKWRASMPASIRTKEKPLERHKSVNFVERLAQWRLNKRGTDGETIIHLLLNRGDIKSVKIAQILIELFPGLVLDIYECDDLYGQSSLHLAIVQDDCECIDFLLEKGANVNQRATGEFFWPEDQKYDPPVKRTNFEGYAYYGEYPLAFAASFGSKDIYDSLIKYGANPNSQDSFGNTVLHICVINNSIEMYSYAVKHWARPADVHVVNKYGETPLTLATKLGKKKIFEEMLELMKVEFWRFRDMAYSAYPLTALDTIHSDGTTNWDSALMTIIHGNKPEHMEMIGSEVVQRLLTDKWKLYAFRKFCERLLFLILHLLCMSIGIYLREPSGVHNSHLEYSAKDYIRFTSEIITCACCVIFVFVVQGTEFKTEGFYGFFKGLPAAPEKGIFFFVNILILLCIPLRFLKMAELEDSFLVIALPGSWIYLLFFARAGSLTGPFVQIIYSMIAGDILRFAIISLVFFIGFAQAFYFIGKDVEDRQKYDYCDSSTLITSYSSFIETAITLLRASMGSYEYDDFSCLKYEGLIKVISVVFMFIMPIMLVNMLIAMMGNTYNLIISQAEKASKQQWARIVILLERAHSKEKLAKCQEQYSIEISRDADTGTVTRGLMVIVQTKKTRTAQRNSAVASWKRIFRKVLREIRLFKMNEMMTNESDPTTEHDNKQTTENLPPSLGEAQTELHGNSVANSNDGLTVQAAVKAFVESAVEANMHHIEISPEVAAALSGCGGEAGSSEVQIMQQSYKVDDADAILNEIPSEIANTTRRLSTLPPIPNLPRQKTRGLFQSKLHRKSRKEHKSKEK